MHKKQNSINNYQKKSFVFLKKVLPLQAEHKICKNNYNSYHSNLKNCENIARKKTLLITPLRAWWAWRGGDFMSLLNLTKLYLS